MGDVGADSDAIMHGLDIPDAVLTCFVLCALDRSYAYLFKYIIIGTHYHWLCIRPHSPVLVMTNLPPRDCACGFLSPVVPRALNSCGGSVRRRYGGG